MRLRDTRNSYNFRLHRGCNKGYWRFIVNLIFHLPLMAAFSGNVSKVMMKYTSNDGLVSTVKLKRNRIKSLIPFLMKAIRYKNVRCCACES